MTNHSKSTWLTALGLEIEALRKDVAKRAADGRYWTAVAEGANQIALLETVASMVDMNGDAEFSKAELDATIEQCQQMMAEDLAEATWTFVRIEALGQPELGEVVHEWLALPADAAAAMVGLTTSELFKRLRQGGPVRVKKFQIADSAQNEGMYTVTLHADA